MVVGGETRLDGVKERLVVGEERERVRERERGERKERRGERRVRGERRERGEEREERRERELSAIDDHYCVGEGK